MTVEPRTGWGRPAHRRVATGAIGAIGLMLGALVVGCGSTGETLASRRTASTAAPSPDGDPGGTDHAIGERVALGAGSVAVVDVEDNVDAGRLFAPPRGTRYFAAQVRGCAGPAESGVNFNPEYFAVRLADRTEHDGDRGMKKPALRSGTIPAGGCSEGWVTFVVPARATPGAVIYHGSDDVIWTVNDHGAAPRTDRPAGPQASCPPDGRSGSSKPGSCTLGEITARRLV